MATLRGVITLIVLGGAVAGLGLWIRDEGARPLPSPDDLVLADLDEPAALPLPGDFKPIPFERFAGALERPLFSRSRRPPDVPSPAVEPAAPALTATLTGVLFAGSGSVALVTEVGASAPVRISEGEELNGWTLVEIQPDNVIFEQAGETVTLELIYRDHSVPAPENNRTREN